MLTPRPYQSNTIHQLYDWLRSNTGNPCIVLPTGSGKSIIIAMLCQDSITNWPNTRILMVTHQKELIRQNSEKLRTLWPNAPIGIFSAGLKRKELDEPITFAGIQSIRRHWEKLGHIDLILVDEAHLISHKETGAYRGLISDLSSVNPALRVIGLSATPWRLGHGLITEGEALFDGLIEPTSIEELQYNGFLALLKSRRTKDQISTAGVHKRGGEFIESELQAVSDTLDHNRKAVQEIMHWGTVEERKHWLIFCTGVDHAEHIAEELRANGITAEAVTGKTSNRDDILTRYQAGEIQAVCNCQILTTGFDFPGIDLIAFLRPTASPVLYAQMAGRGLRLKPHTNYCRVLDFVGAVQTHGPITAIQPPAKKGKGDGVAPAKLCPECDELLHASIMVCPECGFEFPPNEKNPLSLHNDDIQGDGSLSMPCTGWSWEVYTSKKSQKEMIRVSYYGGLSDVIHEFLCIWHDGFAQRKGIKLMNELSDKALVPRNGELNEFLYNMTGARFPAEIVYKKNGRYKEIIDRVWGEE